MRRIAIGCGIVIVLWPLALAAGRGPGGGGSPIQVDNRLRTPAFQPLGPDYSIGVNDYGLLGPGGRNAYFSFTRFDIPGGSSASFVAPAGVRNVLARVTGSSASHLNGVLRVNVPGANFFLLNPNGILIGAGASFDLSGSLVLSTADELRFKDATFSAAGGGNGPAAVLSSANPIAFGFLNRAPAKISVTDLPALGAPLTTAGKTLSLVGGEIEMSNATLRATAGRMNLVAIGSSGVVTLDASARSKLTVNADGAMGRIAIGNDSALELGDGGNLFVRARDFSLDRSTISARSEATPGKKVIDVRVSGAFSMTGQSFLAASVGGAVEGTRITIEAKDVALSGNSRITSNVGTVNSDAADPSLSAENALASGRAGDIHIHTGSLTLADQGQIQAFAFGPGKGADVELTVAGAALLRGSAVGANESTISFTGVITKTDDQADASQRGGTITLRAGRLEILRGGELVSTTKTARDAGDVTLAVGDLFVDGTGSARLTGVEARAGDAEAASGAGGNIFVGGLAGPRSTARSVRLVNGGVLSASSFGRGDGGNVVVRTERAEMSGPGASGFTGLFARSVARAPALGPAGDGGNVSLFADSAVLRDGASISASSRGAANAGSVLIHARALTLDNASVGAASLRGPRAGDVTVEGALDVLLLNHSAMTTRAANDGGNIRITARDVVRVDHSLLTAQSGAAGKTLTIDPQFIVLNAAVINGVDLNRTLTVTLSAANFLRSPDSLILSTLPPRLPPDVDLSNKVTPLQSPTLEAAARLLEACQLRLGGAGISSFLITGRGGTPVAPGGQMPALELPQMKTLP